MDGFKKISSHVWILAAIIILGFFLRSYNFHDWLHFGKDQARDALITQAVARGEKPWPLLGAAMGNTDFKIGPAYYYFQIVSAKIFGQDPAVLAYPDLFFSILSIPLLYLFLKKCFNRNVSLILIGIYAVSYFSVEYARFAWNPNPIPFFTLLFLLGMFEFLIAAEKVGWKWIIAAGLALGVGTQLHAILLILLPTMAFLVSLFIFIKNRKTWKKILAIFLVAFLLNLPQITGEFQDDFSNTKLFFSSLGGTNDPGEVGIGKDLLLNVSCHAQANMHMISSLGDRYDCNYVSVLTEEADAPGHYPSLLLVAASFLFSLFGYGFLSYRARNDRNKQKRYFLTLIAVYCVLYFPLLLPAIDGASHRYFIGLVFMPYVFLGFFLEFLLEKRKKGFFALSVFSVVFLVASNFFTVLDEARQLQSGERGNSGYVVLGQIEEIRDYMLSKSNGEKEVYLLGGSKYLPFYAVAMQYVFAQKDVRLIRVTDDSEELPPEKPTFYIWKNFGDKSVDELRGKKALDFRNFGKLSIYELQNDD